MLDRVIWKTNHIIQLTNVSLKSPAKCSHMNYNSTVWYIKKTVCIGQLYYVVSISS